MNILILTYQGGIAGSTYSISCLARGLAQKGHNVYVGCSSDSLLATLVAHSKVHLIPMQFRSKFDLANMRHIRDLVRQFEIDIINAQSSYDRYTSVFARLLFKLPVNIVHTRRQVAASMGGWLQNLIYYRGTDKVIAVSNGVKDSLIGKGLPAHHIEVIYNGTPREKYQGLNPVFTQSLKEKYGISKDEFVIGCVSRPKRQEQIIQALEFLPFRVKLILVGLERSTRFEHLLEKIQGRHEVIFTGFVPPHEVLDHYALFDIHVLASVMEGLSQSLLEAMALGIPVIATHAAGNPELVTDGVNGFTFYDQDIAALAEKIIRLHDDAALRERFIQQGKITALEDFSIEKTVDRHELLFNDIIENK